MNGGGKIILGIDPGTLVMGYAIILSENNKFTLLEMDVLSLRKEADIYKRLELIHKKVCDIIGHHKPDMFAIEAPFYGKNVQSMLKLGRAQGVAIAAAMQASIPVTEYSPRKIKQSITGNGNASKEQVLKMLERLIKLDAQPKFFDASDALAVAICHCYQHKPVIASLGKPVKDWNDFIQKNMHRVKQ